MKKFLTIILIMLLIGVFGNTAVLSQEQSYYNTREIIRVGNYKLIEMYVYDNDVKISRRITFELPAEWYIDGSSVVGLRNEENIDDYSYSKPYYKLKVDMWNIINSTRENALNEFNDKENADGNLDIIDEKIYSTVNYEIFYYKFLGNEASDICCYYLYSNGERFSMTGYVFDKDKPEYDNIFRRIAESVKFQFASDEIISSPATGDNILIFIFVLSIIFIIFMILPKKFKRTK